MKNPPKIINGIIKGAARALAASRLGATVETTNPIPLAQNAIRNTDRYALKNTDTDG